MEKNNNQTQEHFFPRRLARKVAKANMQRQGFHRVNRHFADNWRNHVNVRERKAND